MLPCISGILFKTEIESKMGTNLGIGYVLNFASYRKSSPQPMSYEFGLAFTSMSRYLSSSPFNSDQGVLTESQQSVFDFQVIVDFKNLID